MANVLAELLVKITADSSKLKSGFADAEKATNSFGDKLEGLSKRVTIPLLAIGGAITGALGAATVSFAETADNLEEMSQRTGVSTKALQELGYAAKLSGASVEGLEGMVKKMQVNLVGATDGVLKATEKAESLKREIISNTEDEIKEITQNAEDRKAEITADDKKRAEKIVKIEKAKTAAIAKANTEKVKALAKSAVATESESQAAQKAFAKLGINVKQLRSLNPEGQFIAIAEAIAEIEDPTERAALAVDIFGRSGTDLLPMLANGKAGLKGMKDEAHRLGLVMDDASIKTGAKMKDALDAMGASVDGLKNKIGIALAPILTNVIEKITNMVAKMGEWIAQNPEAIKAIGFLGIAILGVVIALKAMAVAAAVAQALSGPAGWAALAAGLAIAGGAMWGLNELFKNTSTPGLASGGIVTSPTLAMVGESGPEAIVPLGQMGGESSINLYIDGEQITRVIERRLGNRVRLSEAKNYV